MKLNRAFYDRDTITVARELLGKILVHMEGDKRIAGKIVEVEAYMGPMDKAAHSYNNRKTERVMVMYGEPGKAYVFMLYGMHYCFNVVSNSPGKPEAVLIRGLEPTEGDESMSLRRYMKTYKELSLREIRNLTNGPAKLCSALGITKSNNWEDLLGEELFIEYGESEGFDIVATKRIGIDYAEEARDYPWRFYIEGNEFVSK